MVVAAEVAAAVGAAMVAEDGLVASRWSCLPVKVYGLSKVPFFYSNSFERLYYSSVASFS